MYQLQNVGKIIGRYSAQIYSNAACVVISSNRLGVKPKLVPMCTGLEKWEGFTGVKLRSKKHYKEALAPLGVGFNFKSVTGSPEAGCN